MSSLRCSHCGQFIAYGSDFDTFTCYGSAIDLEPPDDCHICSSCSKKEEQIMIEELKNKKCFRSTYWHMPLYEKRALKKAGFVLTCPAGEKSDLNGYVFYKSDSIPEDYQILSKV